MTEERGHSTGTVLLAFLAGALAGAAVALLAAPKSGSQMRESLRSWSTEGRARRAIERAASAARGAFDDAVGGA